MKIKLPEVKHKIIKGICQRCQVLKECIQYEVGNGLWKEVICHKCLEFEMKRIKKTNGKIDIFDEIEKYKLKSK